MDDLISSIIVKLCLRVRQYQHGPPLIRILAVTMDDPTKLGEDCHEAITSLQTIELSFGNPS